MAQRDQVAGALGGHDAGDARDAEHVALADAAFADPLQRRRRHHDPAARHGDARRSRPCRRHPPSRPCPAASKWVRSPRRIPAGYSRPVSALTSSRAAAATSGCRIRLPAHQDAAGADGGHAADVVGGADAALGDRDAVGRHQRAASSSDVAMSVCKVLRLRLLMPISRVCRPSARSSSRPVVHLGQHRHVEAAGDVLQLLRLARRSGRP